MSIALRAHVLSGRGRTGVYSVCSAHPLVIEAAALQAVDDGQPLLLEATSNQVNQDGGYTGMLPEDFRAFAVKIADSAGLTVDQLILGGDHLGPTPWSSLRASEAIEKAAQMVALYVTAGFTKIHLDTSMRCVDDPEYLDDATFAMREALPALACIEEELFASEQRSNLRQTLETVMLSRRDYWLRYYHGTPQRQRLLRFFSYSDRRRYYWPESEVKQAVKKLFANLEGVAIPETLLSQYLPGVYTVTRNRTSLKSKQIVIEHIRSVLRIYSAACRQRLTLA